MPTAQAAIRRYHQQGAALATVILNQTFDRSAYWGPSGRKAAASWANSIRDSFDAYVELASADMRAAVMTPMKRDVAIGHHALGVAPDVVLLDLGGYVARLVLWDKPLTTQDEAELLAAPIVCALDDELGEGRTIGVEVWHLRSREQFYVPAPDALARMDEVSAVLNAYIG